MGKLHLYVASKGGHLGGGSADFIQGPLNGQLSNDTSQKTPKPPQKRQHKTRRQTSRCAVLQTITVIVLGDLQTITVIV